MRPRADIADAVQDDYRTNLVQRVIAAAAVEPRFEVSDPGIVVEFVKLDDNRTGDVVRFETRLSRSHHLWPETMTIDPRRPNSDTAVKQTHRFWTPEEERLTSGQDLTDAQVSGLTGRSLVAIRRRRQQLRFRCRPV
ncbi:hypothetical protein [Sinomonas sp. G460-2]|uniref:hypothetical protein n=1 Tax=Sinomonas sp. G460-2 TaxID=3393464 RepID=UPI0039F0F944